MLDQNALPPPVDSEWLKGIIHTFEQPFTAQDLLKIVQQAGIEWSEGQCEDFLIGMCHQGVLARDKRVRYAQVDKSKKIPRPDDALVSPSAAPFHNNPPVPRQLQYEYACFSFDCHAGTFTPMVDDILNRLGKDGWQLCSDLKNNGGSERMCDHHWGRFMRIRPDDAGPVDEKLIDAKRICKTPPCTIPPLPNPCPKCRASQNPEEAAPESQATEIPKKSTDDE